MLCIDTSSARYWSGSATDRGSAANGSNPGADYLAGRSFEAVEALRYCLLVFFFLVERIIINC